jgi:hypothetical protein
MAGTPSAALTTSTWLVGGHTTSLTTDDSSTEGIWQEVTAAQSSNAVAYAWVKTSSATPDQISITLTDGADTNIENKQYNAASPAGYDKTTTDSAGNTWYRYSVSGSNTGAANFRFFIIRSIAHASIITTFQTDAAYLEVGTTVAPDAWASTYTIENRGDIDASNKEEICHVDVWGIPGDAPALARWYLSTSSAVAPIGWTVGKITDGTGLAANFPHWLDADTELSDASDWTRVAAPGAATDGDYMRSEADGDTLTYSTLDDDTVKALLMHPVRVFALARTDKTPNPELNGLYMEYDTGPAWVQRATANFTLVDTWELLDLGVIHMRGIVALDDPPEEDYIFAFRLVSVWTSDDIELDAVLFVPTEEFMITDGIQDGTEFYFDGHYDRFLEFEDVALTKLYIKPALGTMYRLTPGNLMTRTVWQFTELNSAKWDITSTAEVVLYVKPRTRHLLGTI